MYNQEVNYKRLIDLLPEKYQFNPLEIEEYFIKVGSFDIHVDHHRTATPKGIVFCFHGVGGNGRILGVYAQMMMRLGYDVICPDLPLYGYTKIHKKRVTYEDWVFCATQLVSQLRKDLPTYVFGASAGGFLAYQVTTSLQDIKGLYVTCLLDQRDRYVTQKSSKMGRFTLWMLPVIKGLSHIMGSVKIPMKWVAPMKKIVNDPKYLKILMQDPRSSGAKVSLAFITSMLNPKVEVEPELFDACPIYVIHPQKDKWTDVALTKRFLNKVKGETSIHYLTNGGHFPIELEALESFEGYIKDQL